MNFAGADVAAGEAPVGLTSDEAARGLAQHGRNEVAEEQEHVFKKIARHFWAPVPWMLEASIVLQLVVGERIEAGLIAALLIFNVVLGVFQESRANAALALLKQHLSLKARVRRDGRWTELPAALLVPDDVVQLSLAAVVPADMRIVEGSVLLDQSMLTGESVAVETGAGKLAYAGALVRRGEAVAVVTATGSATYFGRAAELVRIAHVESAEVKAVLGLVRNLSVVNAAIVIGLVGYAYAIALPASQIILLVLTAMLSAVPVALPATFTLAAALGAKHLALKGVLLTRLTALHEAATIDVLCADKTGTLTENKIGVAAVRPLREGWTADDVLAFAALASSSDGRDPIDVAIRQAARGASPQRPLSAVGTFTPFDPASKRAEAKAQDAEGHEVLHHEGRAGGSRGRRAVECGSRGRVGHAVPRRLPDLGGRERPAGTGEPPRPHRPLRPAKGRFRGPARRVASAGSAHRHGHRRHRRDRSDGRSRDRHYRAMSVRAAKFPIASRLTDFAIYAGVFPEEKFRLVKALQRGGHAVGMCGDGANDAPALRQAQMGIAVETATDVAKAAAGLVLTAPGLGGIVTAINEGRTVFQRVLTYTLSILVTKCVTLVVLGAGLVLTGHAVLTPMLQALAMFTNDFVSMARTADRATPSPHPNAWRLRNLTLAAIPLASFKFLFDLGVLATGAFHLGFNTGQIQTLIFIMFVFDVQALVYVLRERGHMWNSRPSLLMMLFSLADIAVVSTLAIFGILMQPLPVGVVLILFTATLVFAFCSIR